MNIRDKSIKESKKVFRTKLNFTGLPIHSNELYIYPYLENLLLL